MGAAGEQARAEFGGYFAEHHREVGLLAYQLCGDRAVAEEVTADAFAEAWRRWNELTHDRTPGPEAMTGIVERLVQSRVRTAGRKQLPPGAEEPDAVRVSALLSERIALIPPADAPTVLIPRIVEPVEPSAPEEPEDKSRRQIAFSGMITAGFIVVLGVIAIAVSTGGHSSPTSHPPLSLAATGTIDAAVTGPASAAVSTSASPSRSASPSPSPSHSASPSASPSPTTASKSPTVATTSAAPSTAAAPPSTTSTALSASGSVNQGSNRSWTQLDVTTSVDQTLSALTISITVANCPGLSAAGAWDSGAGGQFNETTTQNADGSITYVFALAQGSEVTPGDISFAAQFSHSYRGWDRSADSYSVDAVVAGSKATESFGGGF